MQWRRGSPSTAVPLFAGQMMTPDKDAIVAEPGPGKPSWKKITQWSRRRAVNARSRREKGWTAAWRDIWWWRWAVLSAQCFGFGRAVASLTAWDAFSLRYLCGELHRLIPNRFGDHLDRGT